MTVGFRLLLILLITMIHNQSMAVQTNVNKVTDLFDREIENKDQYIEKLEAIKHGGINDIETESANKEIFNIAESKSEAERLSSINASDLHDEGSKARASEEYKFYDQGEFEPDLTKPGNKMHKEDVEAIVKGTSELFQNLMGKLKDINVDCKTVKGPVEKEPVYTVQVKKEQQRDTIYDQFFCEELRNKYSCTKKLSLKCLTPTMDPLTPRDFSGTSLPIKLDPNTGVLTFGRNREFTMYPEKMSEWIEIQALNQRVDRGGQFDHNIKFNLTNKDAIDEFTLKDIVWADHLRITINGHQIFLGPEFHGDRLILVSDDSRIFRNFYYEVIIDETRNRYSTRSDPPYRKRFKTDGDWYLRSPNVDLRPYLKNGENIISIRLIVGGPGGLWLKFKTSFKKCQHWEDIWAERCTIQ